MKIEVLYPKFCNFYGDPYNIKYLSRCSDDIKVYYTDINEKPKFINGKIDMIYLGAMSHVHQELIIDNLKPYKNKLWILLKRERFFGN